MSEVLVYNDVDSLARAAANRFLSLANQAIKSKGFFSAVLSGGSTPQSLYHLLASKPYSEQVNWAKVHLFWGDERCVPPDHADSNFWRARKALLENVGIPEENIHRIPAEKPPEQAAEAYETVLLEYFQSNPGNSRINRSSFDLVLLGMGEDGHTASLFPNTEVIHESTRWVSAVYVERLCTWRISMTPLILNQADEIIFLVAGKNKNWTLQKVLYGSYEPNRYPAQIIKPINGKIVWMLDKAAAIFTA